MKRMETIVERTALIDLIIDIGMLRRDVAADIADAILARMRTEARVGLDEAQKRERRLQPEHEPDMRGRVGPLPPKLRKHPRPIG